MNKYHKKFLESFSSENVIGLFSRYRGASKEITESWGLLEAARNFIPYLNDHKVIIVGDGNSPRTGALFSYFTKADVVSIDPNFNMDHWEQHIKKQEGMGFKVERLEVIKDKVENLIIDCNGKSVLIIWPHSHANMNNIKLTNFEKRSDIALPCCVKIPNNWLIIPHTTYIDNDICSEKRTIHIWNN